MQVRVEDPATWSCDWSEDSGWNGPKLMYMAGLFDEWTSSEVCVNLFCMFWGFHVNCYANHASYRVVFWVFVPRSVLVCFDILREQSASSFQVIELDRVVEDNVPDVQGPLRELATATHCHLPEPGGILKIEVVCSSKASEQSKLTIITHLAHIILRWYVDICGV
jgi:hypothetical protein